MNPFLTLAVLTALAFVGLAVLLVVGLKRHRAYLRSPEHYAHVAYEDARRLRDSILGMIAIPTRKPYLIRDIHGLFHEHVKELRKTAESEEASVLPGRLAGLNTLYAQKYLDLIAEASP